MPGRAPRRRASAIKLRLSGSGQNAAIAARRRNRAARAATPRLTIIRTLMTTLSSRPTAEQDPKISAWSLIKPYWVSEERGIAWGMLITIVVMNLLVVWINVRLNSWNRDFYNALQTK